MYEFRWNHWNLAKVNKHGVDPVDAEFVIQRARKPYPEKMDDDKYRVRGQAEHGDYLQVIYIFDPADVVFVIHARPLTDHEKGALRRRRRR